MKRISQIFLTLSIMGLFITSCKKDDNNNNTTTCNDASHTGYTTIVTDACNDQFDNTLLDGTRLEYKYDTGTDSLWFLISVNSLTDNQAFGVNIMLNIPNGGNNFQFWGNQDTALYNRMITVWVPRSGTVAATDTVGIANGDGVNMADNANLYGGHINWSANSTDKTILLGVKRSDLITDAEFPTGSSITIKTAAAVGSNEVWNDDIYSASASMTLTR